jgi:hypothetical protein
MGVSEIGGARLGLMTSTTTPSTFEKQEKKNG